MIIKKIEIDRFRGFKDVSFELGDNLTIITGQNGTQKTTVLGILTQTFSINKKSPFHGEKPLCGGNYKSSFGEKFKLSDEFDLPKEHEWTLHTTLQEKPYTVQSMERDKKSGTIRFWQKGGRTIGTGYLDLPVIYLSLKRLIPIGEDPDLSHNSEIELTDGEKQFFEQNYKDILITQDTVESIDPLSSKNKSTAGISSSNYDWKSNSSGQDNIGKILLAVISLKRLKAKYSDDYKGGIIAIDEIDATLYPGSQLKLINKLFYFSEKFGIQFIATTHSLSIIEETEKVIRDGKRSSQAKHIFLRRVNSNIVADIDPSYQTIKNHLNVAIGIPKHQKIKIYTEDDEGKEFAKALLGNKFKHLEFVRFKLGCTQFFDLIDRKFEPFLFPNSIIVLDGDSKIKSNYKRYLLKKIKKNIVILPGDYNPESTIANFLSGLDETDDLWQPTDPDNTYTKQMCFSDHRLDDIKGCRKKAKAWYKSQKNAKVWGQAASKVYKKWASANSTECSVFIDSFEDVYSKIAKEIGLRT